MKVTPAMVDDMKPETLEAFRTLYRYLERAGRMALDRKFREAREVLHEGQWSWETRRLTLRPEWFSVGMACIREVNTRINAFEAAYEAMALPLVYLPKGVIE